MCLQSQGPPRETRHKKMPRTSPAGLEDAAVTSALSQTTEGNGFAVVKYPNKSNKGERVDFAHSARSPSTIAGSPGSRRVKEMDISPPVRSREQWMSVCRCPALSSSPGLGPPSPELRVPPTEMPTGQPELNKSALSPPLLPRLRLTL